MAAVASELASALIAAGRERPDALAFRCGAESLTSGRLLADAARLAAGLVERGVRRGDRLALLLPAGLEFVRGLAGAALAGAIPFAVSPELAATTALRRVARGRPAVALANAGAIERLRAADRDSRIPIVAIESLSSAAWDPPSPPYVDPEQPLFLQQTSGSTGEPKLARVSHRALAAWRRQAGEELAPRRGDVQVGWVPPWHVMGLVRFVLLPMLQGIETHLVPPGLRTLGDWLETAASVRATLTAAPDLALRMAVRLAADRPVDLGALRLVVAGGEPVRAATIRDFERRFDLRGVVCPAYGLVEATLAVTSARPGEPLEVDAEGNVSCGRPLSGVEVRITGPGPVVRPTGEAGEIEVRCDSLFSGYLDEPDGPSQLLAGGWLATGDWGRLGAAGELYVLGRRRNLIKHGGATHAARELEEAAESVGAVVAAGAVALAREGRAGAVAVVVVEVPLDAPAAPESVARDVAIAIRRDVGILPGEVLVVAPGTLPRTESGKLRHLELRAALAAGGLPPSAVLFGSVEGWTEEEPSQ